MNYSRQTKRMWGWACSVLAVLLSLAGQAAVAQSDLPIVRASSRTVDIRDGKHFKKGYWAVMPERKPDYYYTEIPEKPGAVTFITDMDSITFNTAYGREYDFILLLDGKDSCYTRISAMYRNLVPATREKAATGPDTIPFTLGDNSKIYLKGSVNGSQPLDIQFDLGAGGSVIKKSSVKKVNMDFDGTITLHNTDGSNQVLSASRNLLQLGNLIWDSVSVAVADNMTHREDLIVGNSLFKGRILEINYDKMILVAHDTLPGYPASDARHDLVLDGGVIPFMEISLSVRGRTKKGWAMFDTGAYTSILNSWDVPVAYRILGELTKMVGLDPNGFTPTLGIGNHEFSGFNYNAQNMGKTGFHMILGNDLLKRFNVILDNRSGYLYLESNSLAQAPYGKRGEYFLALMGLLLLSLLLVAGIVVYRKINRNVDPAGSSA